MARNRKRLVERSAFLKKADPSEHSIQSKLIAILPPLLRPDIIPLAIPNGGLRHPKVALELREEGLLPGSPDLVFPLPGGFVAWLEMKKRGGVLSDPQLGMRARLLRLGHLWGAAESIDEALAYLAGVGVLK